MNKFLKIFLQTAGVLGAVMLLCVTAYVMYMLLTYHRIEDRQELTVNPPLVGAETAGMLECGRAYGAVTYNIGFGAYTPDFSFFMDGGKYSWAESEESVRKSVAGAAKEAALCQPDFVLFQEVDTDSTRSYHVNQNDILRQQFEEYYWSYAVNYDSSFILYPFTKPHGSSKSGLVTYSAYPITASLRRSLPISTSLSKFVDLDRCYSISRIPVDNGRELVLVNLHLSAYGNSDEIRKAQTAMLCEDLEREYAAGNYVICGGDFNHDLKALESGDSAPASWAYPFPREILPEHFSFCIDFLDTEERLGMWDSARNADMEYEAGVTYTVTLDGFIVSDNVECLAYENINTGYLYSDHDPVYLKFLLKEQAMQ